jgi:hypothetical protein
MKLQVALASALLAVPGLLTAQDGKGFVAQAIDARAERYGTLA